MDRRGLLYFVVILCMLAIWLVVTFWNNSMAALRNEASNQPTPNFEATLTARLTSLAPNAAQQTQVFEFKVEGAVQSTLAAQLVTATAVSAAQTATAIPQITATADAIRRQQAATATAIMAQQATNQAATATLSANGTLVTSLGVAARATQMARNAEALQLDAALANAGILDAASASKLQQAIVLKHSGPVERIIFTADGSRIASASGNEVILWTTRSGQPSPTIRHETRVNDMAFSPDGSVLATATDEGTVWLWDSASGANKSTLKGHTDSVFKVAFSPDGKLLASAGKDAVLVWNAETGDLLSKLPSGWAWTVSFSPGGRYLLTAGGDGNVRVWAVPVIK